MTRTQKSEVVDQRGQALFPPKEKEENQGDHVPVKTNISRARKEFEQKNAFDKGSLKLQLLPPVPAPESTERGIDAAAAARVQQAQRNAEESRQQHLKKGKRKKETRACACAYPINISDISMSWS